jgi:hypothetical protein
MPDRPTLSIESLNPELRIASDGFLVRFTGLTVQFPRRAVGRVTAPLDVPFTTSTGKVVVRLVVWIARTMLREMSGVDDALVTPAWELKALGQRISHSLLEGGASVLVLERPVILDGRRSSG